MNHAELVRRTGAAAIRTVVLPVRVQIAFLYTKAVSALAHAGATVLKYVAAAAIPLLVVIVFFLFAASLLSGIAGEEEQFGYASSGYEIVAYGIREAWPEKRYHGYRITATRQDMVRVANTRVGK